MSCLSRFPPSPRLTTRAAGPSRQTRLPLVSARLSRASSLPPSPAYSLPRHLLPSSTRRAPGKSGRWPRSN
uniref:Uncharacterized protein n=1 Tax=Setaria viridis TaxID=4556 RepID=A0A4U6VT67_SETVI|nr:hypothetical protein SEVIR_2G150701v2 [Setaria viridis]